jgi:hypothetical protein
MQGKNLMTDWLIFTLQETLAQFLSIHEIRHYFRVAKLTTYTPITVCITLTFYAYEL